MLLLLLMSLPVLKCLELASLSKLALTKGNPATSRRNSRK